MIPDTHLAPDAWGIRPVLFTVAGVPVAAYGFFVLLGLLAAVALYLYNARGRRVGGNGLVIAGAAVVGGILGAKLPIWIVNLPRIVSDPSATTLLSGRTIVGGIIGGMLAVWLVKRRLGIRERLGNYLVPSLALGIAFGRIGCYLTGCCYGTATGTSWGIDFGDHALRHPTQLYEAGFALLLFAAAQTTLQRWDPGALFRAFMLVYFTWRFVIEFWRVSPASAVGLTYYQLVTAAVVLVWGARLWLGTMGGGLDERRDAAA